MYPKKRSKAVIFILTEKAHFLFFYDADNESSYLQNFY